jgi:hypothetical protein
MINKKKLEKAIKSEKWNWQIYNKKPFKLDLSYINLKYANLRHADLIGANLKYSDLSEANLNGANLSYANIDFMQFICGFINYKADINIINQWLYHICSIECDNPEWQELRKQLIPLEIKSEK